MIPFLDMRAEIAAVRAEIDAAIARVVDSGVFVGGPEVSAFEAELAARCGVARAIGVSSGTDALHVLGMALGVGPGEEVATTPLTFGATAAAFARLGARIVFADVDDATLNLDPSAALAACTPRTKLVVPVHLFGLPAALPDHPRVVEDAAQSIGAAPVRGRAAAVSFFPTKNLGALGDAGAVLTEDPELADRVSLLRTQGARPRYHHVAVGGNFRLDAIQAAVLRVRLAHLDAAVAARRAHAAAYRARLAGAPVRLPPDDPRHVYHQFVLRAPHRDELRAFLAARGIGTEVYYPTPLHQQPAFATGASLPVAERACAEVLALPIHAALAPDAPARVADAINEFYGSPA